MPDPKAEQQFRQIFEQHHRVIVGYFYRRLDPDEALDAAADVFLVAWRRLGEVPRDAEARKWLYAVSQRVLANHERSHRRSRRLIAKLAHSPSQTLESPEALVVRRSREQRVLDAVAGLRARDQEVIRLAYWDELPHSDIADLLGCSRSAVDVRIHRAIKRLRKEFERTGHRGPERRETQHKESRAW
jgi:RNA polymerase sigma-70 factor (ECF subfamily)